MASNWAANYKQRFASVNNVSIHYIDTDTGAPSPKGILLLIHGFPQTCYQYRHVAEPFTRAGYRVIIPDYRGAGRSSKTIDGLFTKSLLASDLHELIRTHLAITSRIHIVGHDIGGMIAHAYAACWPAEVAGVVWGECPLPGTASFEKNRVMQSQFHFSFNAVPSLPETLVAGKERAYVKHFFDNKSYNAAAVSDEHVDVYARAFEQPGAARCGFGLYRAFETDKEENLERRRRHGKCKVPALALSGDRSQHRLEAREMVEEMYETVDVAEIEDSAHYVAEENPKDFVEKVLAFLKKCS